MKFSKGYALPMLLIIALGAIGFSYAWWTETLVIDDNVNTGKLDVKIVNKGYGFWGGVYWRELKPPITGSWSLYPGPDEGHTLIITIGNLYPDTGCKAQIIFPIVNTGTIPAKIESVILTVTNDPGGLASYIKTFFWLIHFSARDPSTGQRTELWRETRGGWGIGTIPLTQLDDEIYNCLISHGGVLKPDEAWRFDGDEEGGCIGFRLDESAPNSLEGQTITFTLTFNFEQWNAPAP